MIYCLAILVASPSCQNAGKSTPDTRLVADVIIYGGTSSAVIAAVQVAQMGKEVILVSPDKHLGGLTSSGLGWTDTGNKAVIGGLARVHGAPNVSGRSDHDRRFRGVKPKKARPLRWLPVTVLATAEAVMYGADSGDVLGDSIATGDSMVYLSRPNQL